MSTIREVTRIVQAHRQREGAGFAVRRPLPTIGFEGGDPFLLIDEMGPVTYGPGEAVGAPDHPHRGFETVTYMLDGQFEHEDSAGHRGTLRPGDVQWMTAGAGIVHSEMPSREIREHGGRIHGFQIWINLPMSRKLATPRYQELPKNDIPTAVDRDGLARVVVVAGEALGVGAAIETNTPIVFHDWTLAPGADVSTPIPADHQVLLYCFGGGLQVGDRAAAVDDGQLAVLERGGSGDGSSDGSSGANGDQVRMRRPADATESARVLLLAGVPLDEPVVRHGPFVMNTAQEILQAIRDYQSGRMGEITRTATLG